MSYLGGVNTLCFNDVVTGPAEYIQRTENWEYTAVSVSDASKYSVTKIPCNNSTSADAFAEFVMEKVFKITNSGAYTNFSDSYTEYKTGSGADTSYITMPTYNAATGVTKTHLAGTILSFQCELPEKTTNSTVASKFNVAILLEEVFKDDKTLINKANIELRDTEPLIKTISDVNGVVYDIKKGVKVSDFSKFIEQWDNDKNKNDKIPTGYIRYNSIAPSNQSIGIDDDAVKTPEADNLNLNNMKYGTQTTAPDDSGTTYFTGYIVIGGFNKETKKTVDGSSVDITDPTELLSCRPYITILRVEKSAVLKNTSTTIANCENMLFKDITGSTIATNPISTGSGNYYNIPSYSLFNTTFASLCNTSGCTISSNYYVLRDLI